MSAQDDFISSRVRQERALERYKLIEMQKKLRERYSDLRINLPEFIKQTFRTVSPAHEYEHNWHVDAIAEYLNACERGEVRRLIINMPPRSLKSISVAVSWPAFLLGHNPSTQIISSSYSKSLSDKHSIDSRAVINSRWYGNVFPDTKISREKSSVAKFITTARGHRMSVSIGSNVTGEGGDFIIVDDPHNPKQAASDAERQHALDYFDQTLTSRANNKKTAVFVVVMQRLHEMDLTGHLLEKGGWEHLNLRAVAENSHTIHIGNFFREVKKGEFLHPSRLDKAVLEETEREMGKFAYAGQYQQNPSPDEGGILKKKSWRKWLRDTPPVCDMVFQTLDTSFGESEENDLSVILTWGIFKHAGIDPKDPEEKASLILLDAEFDTWEYPELKRTALASYKYHTPDRIIIEFKASGQSLLQDLRKMRLPVQKFKVEKDKVYRANISAPILDSGHVFYMDRDWAKRVIHDCAVFPNGKYKDIVDAVTMAFLYVRKRFWMALPEDGSADDSIPYQRPKKPRVLYGGAAKHTGE
ncbi:MAG: phage terminase large subunit [Candidatus Binatia bacterium]